MALRCPFILYKILEYEKKHNIKITLENIYDSRINLLKVIYHPLYSMNNFVTNQSKLSQDGAQVFPYMG